MATSYIANVGVLQSRKGLQSSRSVRIKLQAPMLANCSKRLSENLSCCGRNWKPHINDMIWVITGLGLENGRILTERNDATRQITILLALVERNIAEDKHPNGNKEKLLRTLDQIDILRENRNAIIHGSWGEIDGVPVTASLRFKSSNLSEVVMRGLPATDDDRYLRRGRTPHQKSRIFHQGDRSIAQNISSATFVEDSHPSARSAAWRRSTRAPLSIIASVTTMHWRSDSRTSCVRYPPQFSQFLHGQNFLFCPDYKLT